MAIALINGQAYDYTQIIVNILGAPLAGVSSINYETSQEKANNYGTGNKPVSRGRGAKEYSGDIEMSMNDIEALRAAAPNNDLTELAPFSMVVYYGNPQNPTADRLTNVEFTTDKRAGSQGDTDLKASNDLAIGEIIYGR